MDPKELVRRCKNVAVEPQHALAALCGGLVIKPDMPDDALVIGVFEDSRRRDVIFQVCHPSFPVVPVGQYPENIPYTVEYRQE